MDVMLDLETLGTRPDCVILTLGAVKFNPYTADMPGPGLYLRPDVDEQISRGREVQEETVEWWLKQAEDVREEALSGAPPRRHSQDGVVRATRCGLAQRQHRAAVRAQIGRAHV